MKNLDDEYDEYLLNRAANIFITALTESFDDLMSITSDQQRSVEIMLSAYNCVLFEGFIPKTFCTQGELQVKEEIFKSLKKDIKQVRKKFHTEKMTKKIIKDCLDESDGFSS